jgi:hypothetical protein
MQDYLFMWAILLGASIIGYIVGAHNVQRQWRRKMAWTFQEESIEQQMAQDGYRIND